MSEESEVLDCDADEDDQALTSVRYLAEFKQNTWRSFYDLVADVPNAADECVSSE